MSMRPLEVPLDSVIESTLELLRREVTRIVSGSPSKKIIIYGAGARGIVLHETLRMMGYEVAYFIDTNVKKQNTTVCGIPVHEPARIIGEDPGNTLLIIAVATPSEVIAVLERIGFVSSDNVSWIFDNESLGDGIARTGGMTLIDFFLGYNRQSDLPGIRCLKSTADPGDSDGKELKILILGNSTTDPEIIDPVEWNDREKRESCTGSWPRFLHDLLTANGIPHIMYNGGFSSYISGQEMLKLIRDGLPLKPDIVICMDGVTDPQASLHYDKKYSKYHSYYRVLEESISTSLSNTSIPAFGRIAEAPHVEGFCHGIEMDIPTHDEWCSNQRIMRAICREFDIEYICFLQPAGLLLSDYVQSCNIMIRTHWFLWNFFIIFSERLMRFAEAYDYSITPEAKLRELFQDWLSYRHDHVEEFYTYAKDIARSNDFIIDIADMLDGYPDVYFDSIHCNMKGNRLIAERVLKELESREILSRALSRMAGDDHS